MTMYVNPGIAYWGHCYAGFVCYVYRNPNFLPNLNLDNPYFSAKDILANKSVTFSVFYDNVLSLFGENVQKIPFLSL